MRTIEEWQVILKGLDSVEAAKRILGDVVGSKNWREHDTAVLASALVAWTDLHVKKLTEDRS